MALTPKEQKQLNNLQKEYASLQDRIAKNGRAGHLQAQKFVELERKILQLEEKRVQKSNELLSIEQQEEKLLSSMEKKMQSLKYSSKDILGLESKHLQFSKEETKQIVQRAQEQDGLHSRDKQINALAKEQLGTIESINDGNLTHSQLKDLEKQINQQILDDTSGLSDVEKEILTNTSNVAKSKAEQSKQTGIINKFLGEGEETMKAMTGHLTAQAAKWLTIGGLIAIFKNMLDRANAAMGESGKEFGALGMQGDHFNQTITDSLPMLTDMGLEVKDLTGAVATMSGDFGIGLNAAADMGVAVLDSSKAMGLQSDEGSRLFGMMMSITGESQKMTEMLLEATAQFAYQNDVAPQAVLKDIANNAEFFAINMKDGGKNVLESAVRARQLGINLDKVSNIAKGLLDFESSMRAELEASVMIGRKLDFTRARQLALTGDTLALQEEIVRLAGSEEEFNSLNTAQRMKFAQALNMEVGDLAKIIQGKEQEKELQEELNEQKEFERMTAEHTMTQMDKMYATFQAIADDIAIRLIPHVQSLAGYIENVAEWLMEGGRAAKIFAGLVAFSIGKTMLQVAANLALGASLQGISTGGWGIAVAVASAVAAYATLTNMMKTQPMPAVKGAALGADFITSGPQPLIVGDNPGGRERVQVTPLSSRNANGPNSERENILLTDIKNLLGNIKETNKQNLHSQEKILRQNHETFGEGGLLYRKGLKITEVV